MVAFTTVSSENLIARPLIAKWATAEDHTQAIHRQSDARQRDFLLARAVLRALLAHLTGAGDWHICPDTKGKPQALTATGIAGPHISLSHTHGLVACAVSDEGPVGIDIEYWRERDFTALADYAFGPREREEVAHNGISAFYRIWTLREAIAKAIGEGLIATIDGLDSVADAPASGSWATKTWQLFYTSPQIDYSLAMASVGENTWSEMPITLIDSATII